jgi:hypothetical protein
LLGKVFFLIRWKGKHVFDVAFTNFKTLIYDGQPKQANREYRLHSFRKFYELFSLQKGFKSQPKQANREKKATQFSEGFGVVWPTKQFQKPANRENRLHSFRSCLAYKRVSKASKQRKQAAQFSGLFSLQKSFKSQPNTGRGRQGRGRGASSKHTGHCCSDSACSSRRHGSLNEWNL